MSWSGQQLTADAETLVSALVDLVPDLVANCREVVNTLPRLHPDEVALLSPRAVAKRQHEFAAGRLAAHNVLRQLGQSDVPVGKRANGAPNRPQDFHGSITHTNSVAIAAGWTAETPIGIDLEYNEPIEEEVQNEVASENEQTNLRAAF